MSDEVNQYYLDNGLKVIIKTDIKDSVIVGLKNLLTALIIVPTETLKFKKTESNTISKSKK